MTQPPPPPPPPAAPAPRSPSGPNLLARFSDAWSTRLALRAAVVVGALALLVNGVVMALNPGWRTHVAFGTSRTPVTVTEVQEDAVPCGRRNRGDRLLISWSQDGETQEGALECAGEHAVGDRLSVYPVAGERGYEWPAYELWVFLLVMAGLGGLGVAALVALLAAYRPRPTPLG